MIKKININNIKKEKGEFMEPEIKLINENTDLSKIDKINWDAHFNDIPLYVYRVEGYYHGIGGKWGNNDYWCCQRNEEPSYKTLMEFSGNVCNWGISIEEINYHNNEFQHVFLLRYDKSVSSLKFVDSEVEKARFVNAEFLRKEIEDSELSEQYVPHGDYYFKIISEVKKTT